MSHSKRFNGLIETRTFEPKKLRLVLQNSYQLKDKPRIRLPEIKDLEARFETLF